MDDQQLRSDVVEALVRSSGYLSNDEADALLTACNGNAWLASQCITTAANAGVRPIEIASAVEAFISG